MISKKLEQKKSEIVKKFSGSGVGDSCIEKQKNLFLLAFKRKMQDTILKRIKEIDTKTTSFKSIEKTNYLGMRESSITSFYKIFNENLKDDLLGATVKGESLILKVIDEVEIKEEKKEKPLFLIPENPFSLIGRGKDVTLPLVREMQGHYTANYTLREIDLSKIAGDGKKYKKEEGDKKKFANLFSKGVNVSSLTEYAGIAKTISKDWKSLKKSWDNNWKNLDGNLKFAKGKGLKKTINPYHMCILERVGVYLNHKESRKKYLNSIKKAKEKYSKLVDIKASDVGLPYQVRDEVIEGMFKSAMTVLVLCSIRAAFGRIPGISGRISGGNASMLANSAAFYVFWYTYLAPQNAIKEAKLLKKRLTYDSIKKSAKGLIEEKYKKYIADPKSKPSMEFKANIEKHLGITACRALSIKMEESPIYQDAIDKTKDIPIRDSGGAEGSLISFFSRLNSIQWVVAGVFGAGLFLHTRGLYRKFMKKEMIYLGRGVLNSKTVHFKLFSALLLLSNVPLQDKKLYMKAFLESESENKQVQMRIAYLNYYLREFRGEFAKDKTINITKCEKVISKKDLLKQVQGLPDVRKFETPFKRKKFLEKNQKLALEVLDNSYFFKEKYSLENCKAGQEGMYLKLYLLNWLGWAVKRNQGKPNFIN